MNSPITEMLEVIFMAFGKSPAIDQLPGCLSGFIEQHIAIGDTLPSTGESAEQHSVIVALFERPEPDEVVFQYVEQWLTKHLSILSNLDSRKIIEIQSFLDSQTGCRIVTVPNSIIRLCSKAGVDLAHQAIRVLSKSEHDSLRSVKE